MSTDECTVVPTPLNTDEPIAAVVCGKREWRVPQSVLCNASPVLDYLLRETACDTDVKTIRVTDATEKQTAAFMKVVSFAGRCDDKEPLLSVRELADITEEAMPLVHKYDCSGIVRILKMALNKEPCSKGISAIVKYEESVDPEWLSDEALRHLLRNEQNLIRERRMDARLCSRLLSYALFDMRLDFDKFFHNGSIEATIERYRLPASLRLLI